MGRPSPRCFDNVALARRIHSLDDRFRRGMSCFSLGLSLSLLDCGDRVWSARSVGPEEEHSTRQSGHVLTGIRHLDSFSWNRPF